MLTKNYCCSLLSILTRKITIDDADNNGIALASFEVEDNFTGKHAVNMFLLTVCAHNLINSCSKFDVVNFMFIM